MIFARIFYTIYIGGFLTLAILQAVRFIFSPDPWGDKTKDLSIGIAFSLFWPFVVIAPAGREHFIELLAFAFGKKNPPVINVKKKETYDDNSDEQQ